MRGNISQILCAALLFTVLFFTPGRNLHAVEQLSSADEHCNVHQGPCSKQIGDCTIILDISPKPVKAMEDLTFTVALEGACPDGTPVIDLSMPGMIMGEHKVVLNKVNDRGFQGTGVIVRCPSGRTTWQATVIVPHKGSVDVIFDVIY